MTRNRLFVLYFACSACQRGSATSAAPAASSRVAESKSPVATSRSCGPFSCTQYESPREAFRDVLAGRPRALGIGEAHAPKGANVPSAAARFTEELLPELAGRASDLLLELMQPPAGCAKLASEVRRVQEPVTTRQAEGNQGEYVAMGERARALHVVPDLLRPTCGDMEALRDAGDDVGVGLEAIARLSRLQAIRLVERAARSDEDRTKMVVLYGGALHNDLTPTSKTSEQGLRWSYAPALDAAVLGRFVAVDLIVPEFIGDSAAWRALPWWPYYKGSELGAKATLFRLTPQSFVLVFPETRS